LRKAGDSRSKKGVRGGESVGGEFDLHTKTEETPLSAQVLLVRYAACVIRSNLYRGREEGRKEGRERWGER
jgi:hypothetical protein